jgi:hypothetical protein
MYDTIHVQVQVVEIRNLKRLIFFLKFILITPSYFSIIYIKYT